MNKICIVLLAIVAAACATKRADRAITLTPVPGAITPSGGTIIGDLVVPTEAYDDTGWNGDNSVPTKDSIRDRLTSDATTATTTTNATIVPAFDGRSLQVTATAAAITFNGSTGSQGSILYRMFGETTLAFTGSASNWVWLVTAPTVVSTNKVMEMRITAFGGSGTNVLATYDEN